MKPLRGFQLPPALPSPSSRRILEDDHRGGGPPLEVPALSPDESEALVDTLRAAGDGLSARPVAGLIEILGTVAARFLAPSDPLRREAVRRVSREARYSHAMAELVIAGMARDWSTERLRRLVATDFPDPGVLDGFRPGPQGELVRAVGGRFAFHLGAGNVPGVGTTSLIRSLLVKCPVLLKPGRGDVALACLFARALAEADEELARAVAVVYWPGSERVPLEEVALRRAERVAAYAGFEVIQTLKERLPPTTPLVAYHHRISMGAVAREALRAGPEARQEARDAALAVAVFDQRGCVSPQILWVEEGGEISPREWARLLAEELDRLRASLPRGPIDLATAADVQHARGSAELRRAAGSSEEVHGPEEGGWLVLVEPDPRPPPVCLGRTVRVKPVDSLARLPELLRPYARVLQTFAIAAPRSRRLELAEALAGSGVTRITTFEQQPWPPAWWRHDGQGPLLVLVRWVGLEA